MLHIVPCALQISNQQYIVALNDVTPRYIETLYFFILTEGSSVKKLYRHKSGHLDSLSLQKPGLIRVILFSGGKNDIIIAVLVCFHFHF